ncbi:MAG: site-2 protease family protein [Chloroflexi bacterium]|nr:site-2 protease family protein [Chloroflexota bacterium]
MVLLALTIAITVHEFSHGFIACRLGDQTAQRMGRLSLNPLVHLDPLGTLLLFIIGFGWGKPVPVDVQMLRKPTKWSMAAVSAAGAGANLLAAAVVGLGVRSSSHTAPEVLTELLVYVVVFNVILAIFNLIPVPPLDGSKIAAVILPNRIVSVLAPAARWGPLILLGVVVVDNLTGAGVVWRVIGWPIGMLSRLFMGFNPV